MRIAMHNKTIFIAIPVDNLATVTGGYRDADPTTPPAHRKNWLQRFADELRAKELAKVEGRSRYE